jgi:hypothetical protein
MKHNVIAITPTIAQAMLDRNPHNRNERVGVTNSYADDMRAGEWVQNGETIKISVDDEIIDGQHRLQAIVTSGTTQEMLVVSGLPMASQETIDTGIKRTFSDSLKLRGELYYHSLASIVRRIWLWEDGCYRTHSKRVPSNAQLFTCLEKHPEARDATLRAVTLAPQVPVAPAVLGLASWLFDQIDILDAAYYFERLADGAEMGKNHPIMVLRKTLIQARTTQRVRLDEDVTAAIVIKAWNSYRRGQEISHLRWKPGGAKPEAFPIPI